MDSRVQCPSCGAWTGEFCDTDCSADKDGTCPNHPLRRMPTRVTWELQVENTVTTPEQADAVSAAISAAVRDAVKQVCGFDNLRFSVRMEIDFPDAIISLGYGRVK